MTADLVIFVSGCVAGGVLSGFAFGAAYAGFVFRARRWRSQ